MKKVGIIIQARMGSSRLPGKSLMPIGELLLIEWVVRNCMSVNGVNNVILATSDESNCNKLCQHFAQTDIEILRGPENNVLQRYKKAIEKYNLDIAIRITGDDPCHDKNLIEKGLETFKKNNCDYLISSSKEFPLIDGLIFEIFSNEIFNKMYDAYKDNKETQEHVTFPLHNKLMECKKNYIQKDFINPIYKDCGKKICVDTIQDLKLLNECWVTKNIEGIKYPDTEEIIRKIIGIF